MQEEKNCDIIVFYWLYACVFSNIALEPMEWCNSKGIRKPKKYNCDFRFTMDILTQSLKYYKRDTKWQIRQQQQKTLSTRFEVLKWHQVKCKAT